MLIEKTPRDETVIRVSGNVSSLELQRLIDYGKYLEATAKSRAKQSDVNKLAEEVNTARYKKSRQRANNH